MERDIKMEEGRRDGEALLDSLNISVSLTYYNSNITVKTDRHRSLNSWLNSALCSSVASLNYFLHHAVY